MIEVRNLTKIYDRFPAVKDISFSVAEGENLVLLGTSGCGKTTTLKMINRLIEPTSGKVTIQGRDILDQSSDELRRGIGYVIQHVGLFPHYTVEENIGVVPRLLNWPRKRIATRCRELLEIVGLPVNILSAYPCRLSGGQQQRVGIVRALAADPPIVLLDEPFGALDPITRRQIQKEFKNLEEIVHKTMIIVTHDVFEALELGDRICLMHAGAIQQIASAKELLFQPANEFVKNFFHTGRFQLELKILKLRDIVPMLTDRPAAGEVVGEFPEESCLSEVLETMALKSPLNPFFHIKDRKSASGKILLTTSCEEVLAAFYKLKMQLSQK